MNSTEYQDDQRQDQQRENERRSDLDAQLFRTTPIITPAVVRWSNIPGAALLCSDENKVPAAEAFTTVVWSGVSRPLPPAPPPPPDRDADNYDEIIAARLSWWADVRSWRSVCDPVEMGKSWLLSGPCGVGKTRAAIARAQVWSLASATRAASGGRDYDMSDVVAHVAFVRGVEFAMTAVAEAKGGQSEIHGVPRLSNLGKVPFLMLDDLDAGNWTPTSLAALYLVMDDRLSRSLPTIISFNGTATDWRKTVEGRYPGEVLMVDKILRRIRDTCTPVKFGKKK